MSSSPDYLPLAFKLAAKYAKKAGVPQSDFTGTAWLALNAARRDFDPSRGVKFITYAHHKISGYLRAEVRGLRNPRREPHVCLTGETRSKLCEEHAGFAAVDDADELRVVTDRANLTRRQRRVLASTLRGDTATEAAATRGVCRQAERATRGKMLGRLQHAAREIK